MSLVLYTFGNGQLTIQKETRQRVEHEFWSALWWRMKKEGPSQGWTGGVHTAKFSIGGSRTAEQE